MNWFRVAGICIVIAAALGSLKNRFSANIDDWNVPDLQGKVFVVTGSTSGIGLETARALASWNATVIMANRDLQKSRDVAPAGVVEHRELNLASFASTRAFAESLLEEGRRLDVLILNAATQADGGETVDGIDVQYQVNHLSHFLLANMLLPLMNPTSRIIFVSSSMHFYGEIVTAAYNNSAKNLEPSSRRLGMTVYSDTKLMNTMTAVELHRRLKDAGRSGIAVTSVHPGFVQSDLDQDAGPLVRFLLPKIRSLLARETVSGARTQLRVATDKALGKAGGRYFSDDCINSLCAELEPAAAARDPAQRRWLWETSVKLTGLKVEATPLDPDVDV
jgi:NAD(P)-dependent dehydrogenase (short-subunit alcohol dehydrogenase family)